jgi:5-hydroxyisourate hydrolase-like protein (transthyretin family)
MIELRTDKNESIDIEATISIEENNPSFSSDIIPGSFSMPFTLKATKKNSRIFGHPENLNLAKKAKLRYSGITLIVEGLPLRRGELIFRSISKDKYQVNFQAQMSLLGSVFSGVNIRELGHQDINLVDLTTVGDGVYNTSWKGKKVLEFNQEYYHNIPNPFKVKINDKDFESDQSITTEYMRVADVCDQINAENMGVFAIGGDNPTYFRIEQETPGIDAKLDVYFYDYTGWTINQTRNWIKAYHDQLKPVLNASASNAYPAQNFVFPFINNAGLYSEKTKNFTGFINGYYDNQYSFNDWIADRYTGEEPTINWATFCPMFYLSYVFDMIEAKTGIKITGDFVKDPDIKKLIIYNNRTLCKFEKPYNDFEYNLYDYRIKPGNHLPSMTINEFLIELKKMFCLGFDYDDTNRTLKIHRLKNMILKKDYVDFTGKLNPEYDMELSEPTGVTFAYKFESKDEYYSQKSDKSPLNELVIGDGETKKETAWSTLYHVDGGNKYAITLHPGGNEASDFSPRLLFYYGLQPGVTQTVLACFDDTNSEGTVLNKYTLAWSGQKGLYNVWWKEYDYFEQNTELVKRTVYLSIVDLLQFNWSLKIRLEGVNYFVKKLSYSVSRKGLQAVKFELYKEV